MKLSLSDSFRSFFNKNKILEIEDILPSADIDTLDKITDTLLSKKTKSSFAEGRNLWKKNEQHKKVLSSSKAGEIISFLLKKKPVRLAYTQVLTGKADKELPFSEDHTLEDISSADPILGGAILCLRSSTEKNEEDLPDLLKQTEGNIIFFSKDHPIPFPQLLAQEGYQGILIVFAPHKVRYKLQPLDIHTHELKKHGYVFGDLLSQEEAPYLYH